MKKLLIGLLCIVFLSTAPPVFAGEVLGIHVLHPEEIEKASQLLKTDETKDEWMYLTIPFTVSDIPKQREWQTFFDACKTHKFIPLVRLTTHANSLGWRIPTKHDIVMMERALSSLNWPSDERIIIAFNEPNHAKEWGNTLDPVGYADILRFTIDWFHTSPQSYKVLPAAMDLAAPNGNVTMEAFTYWKKVLAAEPEIFDTLDGWNSHSYPNPAFSAAPTATSKTSLRGYQHELRFVAEYSDQQLPVYITETGWSENALTRNKLSAYYEYAAKHIWNDPRIVAVTPFVLQGAPGPFASFSFVDEGGKQTPQYAAYRKILDNRL